jgi:hypothetical protein
VPARGRGFFAARPAAAFFFAEVVFVFAGAAGFVFAAADRFPFAVAPFAADPFAADPFAADPFAAEAAASGLATLRAEFFAAVFDFDEPRFSDLR